MTSLLKYLKREWFLSLLIFLFTILVALDPALLNRSLNFIDYESLSAIVAFFIISRGLEISGIFGRIAQSIVEISSSEFKIVLLLLLITSLSSTIIMNDTAIFVFVPLAIAISRVVKINVSKTVTLTAIAANVGSALSPIGNPQNIIIWRNYKISILNFVTTMTPYAFLWFLLMIVFVLWNSKELEVDLMPKVKVNKKLAYSSIILLILNVVLIENNLYYIGIFLTIVSFLIISREALLSIDLALIAIFALIFIDFREISLLLSNCIVLKLSKIEIILLSAFLSQIVSNVPATVLLLHYNYPWHLLAIGVNVGGTGVIVGSLANFIAIRISNISLKEFHKYSLPYFSIALTATILIV